MNTKNLILIGFFIAFFIQGCKTIKEYQKEEIFVINLENEAIGGYKWQFSKIPEIQIVDSAEIKKEGKNNLMQYTKQYKLKGLKKGTYNLKFYRLRSFENNDSIPAENIKEIEIKINK